MIEIALEDSYGWRDAHIHTQSPILVDEVERHVMSSINYIVLYPNIDTRCFCCRFFGCCTINTEYDNHYYSSNYKWFYNYSRSYHLGSVILAQSKIQEAPSFRGSQK